MAWSTIPPWVSGNTLTAAELITYVRDNLDALTTWVPYSPSLANWTLSDGTLNGWYIHAGDVVDFVIEYTIGASDTFSGSLGISLPVVGPPFPSPIGVAGLNQDGGGYHPGVVRNTSGGDELRIHVSASGSLVATNTPFTWSGADQIYISGRYRVP